MQLASISSIEIDGNSIDLPSKGITILVGPNNSGKSILLRNIHSALYLGAASNPNEPINWLSAIAIQKDSRDSLSDWLEPWSVTAGTNTQHSGELVMASTPYAGNNDVVRLHSILNNWHSHAGLGDLHPWLSIMLDGAGRLQHHSLNSGGPRDPLSPPRTALDRIWDNKKLEQHISDLFERAFGFQTRVNRYSPNSQSLLLGDPYGEDVPLPAPRAFLDELAKLRSITTQGDGVRSFASILISAMAASRPIVLIDEPEAFLHPPQAKLLGRYLIEETSLDTQIVLATHSTDIIHGILNNASGRDVKVIRLSTDHTYSVLDNSDVADLWQDGLLRYSRMLDGLVHQGTVICESDSDCRFYSSVLDARVSSDHDIHFTHVGGKSRLPEAAAKLRRLSLTPAVIADIDLLNDQKFAERMITAVGGSYSTIESDLKKLQLDVESRSSFPTVRSLKAVLSTIISRRDDSRVSDEEAKNIQLAIKRDSGWKEVKRSGTGAFSGDALAALDRVLTYFRQHGVFLVPVGELESWEPTVSGHGPSFVAAVLEQGLHRNPSEFAKTAELNTFTERLADYLGLRRAKPSLAPAEPVDRPTAPDRDLTSGR